MNNVVLTGGPGGPLRSDVISDVEAEIISLFFAYHHCFEQISRFLYLHMTEIKKRNF